MMLRVSPNDRLALFLALLPALLALAALVAARQVAFVAAAVVFVLAAGGIWWYQRRFRPGAAFAAAEPPSSVAIPHEILERLPDPVILLNKGRVIVGVNRAARDLFGIGTPGRDLALSLRHPAVLAAVETVFTGVPELAEEITLPVPIARTFTMHVGRLPESNHAAAPVVILVLHDETRAKRAEQSRADFVANASHELRSPLSSLIGFIETLRGPARSDAVARDRFLDTMRTEALRMARLIEDLLSLSRVEINEHVPPRNALDLAELLEATANALAVRAADKNMEIRIDMSGDLPAVIGDRDQLLQVLHNLVDNAVKYGRPNTPIRLGARTMERLPGTSSPGVAVSVVDHGEGIAAVHLPRVTERFYRADEGRSRKMGGTGLGLAIVKHIVNRHRGQLRIESKKGEGSTFTVLLPAVRDRTPPSGGVTKV